MSICLIAAGKISVIAVSAFTLSWTHSIEKTRWEEDWRLTPAGLKIVEARVKGSGAGMEPPEGATLKNSWWTYNPKLQPLQRLVLAESAATGAGWLLCGEERCLDLGQDLDEPALIEVCN